ncbi:iron-regulated transporter, putative [Metarhizium acridum CQMa 102]|uniref:Solute carrier family 40 member n=1 Tax=Metarhizium acridum (strain CQMa 102) TaxID=655827 RepID=E9DVV8_METAQ|nr:iron-regulated transporter, putative [Metarhizium acridum CQMa 102]EFY92155.1 iron-regulated transporter, putative [Metarhizium acridum CQMa 102]
MPQSNDHESLAPSNSNSNSNTDVSRARIEWQLYTSHFLSMWNSRLFEFGAVLFLASIFPSTLSPMSIYALVRSLSAMLLAHPLGTWIDSGNRLGVVRVSILGQRLAVAGSCGVLLLIELRMRALGVTGVNGLFALLVALACVEKLCAAMNTIAVERDWVVVMTEGDEDWRRVMNARIRRIDLACKLVGPFVISLVAMASTVIAIWTVLGVNVASVLIEYICIERVYKSVPALERVSADEEIASSTRGEDERAPSRLTSFISNILPLSSIPFYVRHPAFLPSFSLSLLHLTVLSFSGQMVTYLMSVGYTPLHVGIARTGSTIVELSATWVAPQLIGRIGPIRGGLWSLNWQMACLAIGVCWYMVDVNKRASDAFMSATVMAICVAFSRLGLWGYDLCAQSIVQEVKKPIIMSKFKDFEVEATHRGSFSTAEATFQNLFELLSFASTIAFSKPDQFQWPMLISITAVTHQGSG